MPDADALVAWLVDLEQLRCLPQRYARAVDQRDDDALAELFDPGGTIEGVGGTVPVPEWLATRRAAPPAFDASMHMLGDPLIDLAVGADVAAMDTYAVVHQINARNETGGDLTLGMRYLDEVRRHGDLWRIHHRVASMTWMRG